MKSIVHFKLYFFDPKEMRFYESDVYTLAPYHQSIYIYTSEEAKYIGDINQIVDDSDTNFYNSTLHSLIFARNEKTLLNCVKHVYNRDLSESFNQIEKQLDRIRKYQKGLKVIEEHESQG